ncbi:hypothetical protein DOT_3918 [Desulfosporosinus sp. OT]|nr:hypothetical protein DOT_3918 [Desulfosporosinus sp. OT]
MLKKTDVEPPLVIEAIRELIKNQDFAAEIKSRIGKEIDTTTLNRELKNYEVKLREVDLNKTRLENEIDSLPEDTRFRERKLHDMTLRLDGLYDIIIELEEKIEDVTLRRKAVEQDAITLENIYTLLANFEKVYDKISDEEKKSLISSLIKEIEIFPCDESELPLKSILFNFPVYKDGGDVCEFLWDKSTHVSTCLEDTKKMPGEADIPMAESFFHKNVLKFYSITLYLIILEFCVSRGDPIPSMME